jgi:alkylhydroperoxidase family enzyme
LDGAKTRCRIFNFDLTGRMQHLARVARAGSTRYNNGVRTIMLFLLRALWLPFAPCELDYSDLAKAYDRTRDPRGSSYCIQRDMAQKRGETFE